MYFYGFFQIDMLQYKLFCANKGDCPCVKLPPCQSSLKEHCLHANYQLKIWRDRIADEFFVPTPEEHGCTTIDGEISIKWMDCKPALEEASVVFLSISIIRSKCLRVEENDNKSKKRVKKT